MSKSIPKDDMKSPLKLKKQATSKAKMLRKNTKKQTSFVDSIDEVDEDPNNLTPTV